MAIAVSGDRSTSLELALGKGAYLFAVAQGFGEVDGTPTAASALARLRVEAQRRAGQERFRRSLGRAESASAALLGIVGRVNGELYARTAAHDDYVTAGCSLTAVLLNGRRAVVAHAGSTGAYLARAGYVVALTQDDALHEGIAQLLIRSVGTQPHLDAAVCSFTFDDGDTLVLSDRRLRCDEDRRRLSERVRAEVPDVAEGGLLLVRYAGDDPGEPVEAVRVAIDAWPLLARAVAALMFAAAMLCTP